MILPPGQALVGGLPPPHLFPPPGSAPGGGMRPSMGPIMWHHQPPFAMMAGVGVGGGHASHHSSKQGNVGGESESGQPLRRSRSSSGGDPLNGMAGFSLPGSGAASALPIPPPPPRTSAPIGGKGPGMQLPMGTARGPAVAVSLDPNRTAPSSSRPVGMASFVAGSVSVSTRRRHSGGFDDGEGMSAPSAAAAEISSAPAAATSSAVGIHSTAPMAQRKQLPPPTAVAAVLPASGPVLVVGTIPVAVGCSGSGTAPPLDVSAVVNPSPAVAWHEQRLTPHGGNDGTVSFSVADPDASQLLPSGSFSSDPVAGTGSPSSKSSSGGTRSWPVRPNLSVSVPTATPVIPISLPQPQPDLHQGSASLTVSASSGDPAPPPPPPPAAIQDLMLTNTAFPPLGSSPPLSASSSAAAIACASGHFSVTPQGGSSWTAVASAPPPLAPAADKEANSAAAGGTEAGGAVGGLRGNSDSGVPSSKGTAQMMPYAVAVALPPPATATTATSVAGGGYAASLGRTLAPAVAKRNLSVDGLNASGSTVGRDAKPAGEAAAAADPSGRRRQQQSSETSSAASSSSGQPTGRPRNQNLGGESSWGSHAVERDTQHTGRRGAGGSVQGASPRQAGSSGNLHTMGTPPLSPASSRGQHQQQQQQNRRGGGEGGQRKDSYRK